MRYVLISALLGVLTALIVPRWMRFEPTLADFHGSYAVDVGHGESVLLLQGDGTFYWTVSTSESEVSTAEGTAREDGGAFTLDTSMRTGYFAEHAVPRLVPISAGDVRYLVREESLDDFAAWLRSGREGPAALQDPATERGNPGIDRVVVPPQFADRVR